MRTIEATGTLDTQGHIQLDHPEPQAQPSRVRIIMLLDNDLASGEWETAIATNPSFAFLHDPKEDIYTLEDGKPVSHEG
jgi:hypothetical protein